MTTKASTADKVIQYCETSLEQNLTDYQKFQIARMFDRFDKEPAKREVFERIRDTAPFAHRDVVINAFEEAAAQEPEWKQIPNFAEFEINREGVVRNILTKLPLKPSNTRNPGFYMRDDRGRKMIISLRWIQDRVHFSN